MNLKINIILNSQSNSIDPLFKLWNQYYYHNHMYKICEHIFKLIKELCNFYDAKLIFVVTMCKEELSCNEVSSELIDFSLPRVKTISILKKLNIDFIDLEQYFKKSLDQVFFDDGHITKFGNALIAKSLLERL